jgi:hypothetical protein
MLIDFLDDEFAWRLQEIAFIKGSIRQAQNVSRKALLRAGVPILYAHWEGFIKQSSLGYINFVGCQRLRYDELASCFIAMGARTQLDGLRATKNALSNIATVDFFLHQLVSRANLPLQSGVNTRSNLSSEVFENIAISIGVDSSKYTTRFKLIDESLLARRNNIAHGQYIDIDTKEYDDLSDNVVELMRWYKTDVMNAAQSKLYLRHAV